MPNKKYVVYVDLPLIPILVEAKSYEDAYHEVFFNDDPNFMKDHVNECLFENDAIKGAMLEGIDTYERFHGSILTKIKDKQPNI